MKKTLALLFCSIIIATAFSQQFIGYEYDNYAGIQSVIQNPASITGSKYKINVNLVSLSFWGGNNAYELDKKKLFRLDMSGLQEGTDYFKSSNTDNKKLWLNTEIVGPSFMVTTGPKSAFGIITRARTIVNEYNLSNNTFQFFNSDDGLFDTDIQERNVSAKMHSFAEAGVAYARTIYSTPTRSLKLGITGKYIVGMGVAAAYSNELLVNIDPAKNINQLNGDFTVQYSSNIDELENSNFADVFNKQVGKGGWGLDAGIIYEWNPKNKKRATTKDWWLSIDPTPYKLKIGLSVTDIGAVKYTNSPNGNSYLIDGTGHPTSELEKQDDEDFDEYFTRLEGSGILTTVAGEEELKVKLPMAIRANVDWHVYKRIFISAGALINTLGKTKDYLSANYTTTVSVTPRLEKKWFSIYSPIYYNLEKQFGWGAGFRVGPLFAGSGSVLSNLLGSKNISATDFHVGLNIPVFQAAKAKHTKTVEKVVEVIKEVPVDNDKDKDGVTDDKDACPDKAGEITLLGCPDTDKDGVADNEDKCPELAGQPKYQGCPVPDTDGDGLNDEIDKCPTIRGSLENHGCPEVKKEVVKKVNTAAKSIYFLTGKAVIRSASFSQLDKVVEILKSDLTLKLRIEGHTDNVGSVAVNERLSHNRAMSVKNYLVMQGIDPERLSAQGYGSSQPVADNSTATGRARNRRVEMHVTYW